MEIWKFDLRRGSGTDPRDGACLLDAVSWFEYGRLGDHPRCVCPVVAAYAREVNDLLPDDWRQRLKPFILRLPGTVDPAAVLPRAEFLMWQAVRVFAPLALEAAASVHPDRHHAASLRGHAAAMRAAGTVGTAEAAAEAAGDDVAWATTTGAAWAAASATTRAAEIVDVAAGAANAAAVDATRAGTVAAARAADAAGRTAVAVARATRVAAKTAHEAKAAWIAGVAAGVAFEAAWTAHEAKDTPTRDEIHTLCISALDGVLKIGERAPPIGIETIIRANKNFALAARVVDAP